MTDEANVERVENDLKEVTQDAEAILQASSGQSSEKIKELRARLNRAVDSAKESCRRLEERAKVGAKATDRTIRDHPYESIGVAFAVGLLIGVLVGRR